MTAINISSLNYLILGLLLSGCAQQAVQEFVPYTVEIKSQEAFQTDLKTCRGYALDYLSGRSSLDASQVAQEGLTGALKGLPSIPISPYVPALGATGNASSEALSELGLNSQDGKKIVTLCLNNKGNKSGQYLTIDPND